MSTSRRIPALEPLVPSPEEVEAARTPAGGWTRAQLVEWGVPWPPPKGWRQRLRDEYAAQRGAAPQTKSENRNGA